MKTRLLITGCLLMARTAWPEQYVISTFAGGSPPPSPIAATRAAIGYPSALATDNAGNVYFSGLNCVFKMDKNGVLTRVAGNSRFGYSGDGGPAPDAQLANVSALAVDGAGSLFIADVGNNRIRRVSPDGIITTIAGDGTSSGITGDGGPAVNAHLGGLFGVAVDSSDNVFVTDLARVRKVSPDGIIATVAGDGIAGSSGDNGPAISARLGFPEALAFDGNGNLFIADRDFNTVRKISKDGIITTVPAPAGLGLTADQYGNLFIVGGGTVTRVAADGTKTVVAGRSGVVGSTGDGGPATKAVLWNPVSVAVDAAGDIFIADSYNYRIRKVDTSGIITTVAGGNGYSSFTEGTAAVAAPLQAPDLVAVDSSGNVFIGDSRNTVTKVSPSGVITTVAGGGSTNPTDGVAAVTVGIGVTGLAVDNEGNLYIADAYSECVRRVSTDGLIRTVAGNGLQGFSGDGGPATSARLNSPRGVAVDNAGNLFIADSLNSRIRKVTPDGIITTVAGTSFGFSGDNGPAISARLATPDGVAVDPSGTLYIADTQNGRIRKVSTSGIITTVAGGSVGFGADGGPATAAQLDHFQVAVDAAGNLFITDSLNNRVRKVTADGIINTIAGPPPPVLSSNNYSGDGGPATSATLADVMSAAVDGTGNVYIADSAHNAVRLLQPVTQSVLIGAIVDAASEQTSPLSPGKIVAIYGKGMGPAQLAVASPGSSGFATQLAGSRVLFNGTAAPVIYTSDTQLAAIVPYSISGTSVQVAVEYLGQISAAVTVPAAASSPSLFSSNGTGAGQAAAINAADLSLNTAADPVKVGGYISLYLTGAGQTNPSGIDGALGDYTPTHPLLPVSAMVGGLPATVQYAGGVFGDVAGLMQVNVQIPVGVQPGGYVPMVVKVGDASSGPGCWIAVSN